MLVNISMIRSTICSMLFAANFAVEQEVIVATMALVYFLRF